MRRATYVLLLLGTGLVVACGPDEAGLDLPGDLDTQQQEVNLASCEEADIQWATTDDGNLCDTPWKYYPKCCDQGLQYWDYCAHAHEWGEYEYTVLQTWVPTKCTLWGWEPGLGKVCEEFTPGYWPSCTTSGSIALTAESQVTVCNFPGAPEPNAISATTTSVDSTHRNCTITVSNMPISPNGDNTCHSHGDILCGLDPDSSAYSTDCSSELNWDGSEKTEVPYDKCNAPQVYSAPGLTRSQAVALQADGAPSEPTCLSCMDSDDTIAQRYTCLEEQYVQRVDAGAEAEDPSFFSTLQDHQQLLFELKGQELTDAQRDSIKVYQDLNCGPLNDGSQDAAYWNPPAPPSDCGTYWQFNALIRLMRKCERLASQPHVSAELSWLEVDKCLAAPDLIDQLPSYCLVDEWSDGHVEVSTELVRKALAYLPASEVDRHAALRVRLATMDAWFERLETMETGADLWRDVEIGAAAVLRGAYATMLEEADYAATIEDLTVTNSDAMIPALELADALLEGPDYPLDGAPAVTVLTSLLKPLDRELAELTPVHDMACRFRECEAFTPASAMFRLISDMADPARIDATLADIDAAGFQGLDPNWRTFFEKVSAAHTPLIQPAILSLTGEPSYIPDSLLHPRVDEEPLAILSAMVADAGVQSENYEGARQFNRSSQHQLFVPLLAEDEAAGLLRLSNSKASVNAAVQDYEAGWRQAITDAMAKRETDAGLATVTIELDSALTELEHDIDSLEVLRRASDNTETAFGALTWDYLNMVHEIEAEYGETWISVGPPQPLTILPGEAMPDYGVPWYQMQYLTTRAPITASRGQLLTLTLTGGQWAPTCALVEGADGVGSFNASSTAMTGPEGYDVVSAGPYYTNGVESFLGTFSSWVSESLTVVGGAVGAFFGGAEGAQVGIQVGSFIGSFAEGLIQGDREQSQVVLNDGLRIPGAPFPTYPVGSLLAVQVPASDPQDRSHIIDIQMVHSSTTTVVVQGSGSVNVYLVVNDSFCPDADGPEHGQLEFSFQTMESAAAATAALQDALVTSIEDLRAYVKDTLLPAGMLLNTDLTYMNSQARYNLVSAAGGSLDSLPEQLISFYDLWVQKVVNQAERAVVIENLMRSIGAQGRRIDALLVQADTQRRRSETLALLQDWEVLDLDGEDLKRELDQMGEILAREVEPFIAVRYPSVMTTLGGSSTFQDDSAHLSLFLGLNEDWRVIAEHAMDMADEIHTQLTTAAGQSSRNKEIIVVGLPKPGMELDPYYDFEYGNARSMYRELSPAVAQTFWAAVTRGEDPQVVVGLNDLYRLSSDLSQPDLLECDPASSVGQTSLVLNRMMLWMATDLGTVWDNEGAEPISRVGSSLDYFTPDGYVPFLGLPDGTDWLTPNAPVKYGSLAKLSQTLGQPDPLMGVGATFPGLPPNLSFEVPFGDWVAPEAYMQSKYPGFSPRVYGLYLVMEVEYRNTGGDFSDVAICNG